MNIVIIGAGSIGSYMASLFSKQKHNVVLIDKNGRKLEDISWQLDVALKEGSGTDWKLLDNLLEMKPDLLLALTNEDEVNLTCCAIAKQLGYPRTIGRVKDNRFLNRNRLDFARLFHVDYFISPELLVAYDIYKAIMGPGSVILDHFAHGAVQMRTLRIPADWKHSKQTLRDLKLPKGIIIGLIYRCFPNEPSQLIFPHGMDTILPGDEVTFIGERDQISKINRFFNIKEHIVKSVVIVGGSLVGQNLAKILAAQDIDVRLIDCNYDRCVMLAKDLPQCRVIHHEGTDLDFLRSEKVEQADYFVTCTNSDELNILAALVAKEAACPNVAIVLSNDRFVPLVNRLGIVHVVAPQLAAANRILSLTMSKAVTSLVFLYDNKAEIVEVTVSSKSKVIGIPLSDIGPTLPKDFLIAMIQNRGRVIIPTGESVICPGDTVIVICHPIYFQDLEKIF